VINNNCTCVYIKENKDKELKHSVNKKRNERIHSMNIKNDEEKTI
jgi:hypothetical protein